MVHSVHSNRLRELLAQREILAADERLFVNLL